MAFNPEQNRIKVLPENRMRALADLHINPTHKKNRDESPAFLLYLNYAVNTICDISGIDVNTGSNGVVNNIKARGDAAIRKLANFFWLFNEDDPDRDFPQYAEQTLAIARKIFELREYFAHLDESGVGPLTMDRKLYELVAGVLAGQALSKSVKPGLQTAKIFKMKLIAVRDKDKQIYEFTRRGLIFFICLALYRDDAMEFTQCLEDMKLPACPKGNDPEADCTCECEDIAACKPGVAKAFISMFTYFSARRGRSVNLLEDDLNYMSFADISGYLNKAPAAAADYLALEQENARLKALAEASTESDDNKKFKYRIHKRFRDRFLSFAAAYCEDFDILPSVKFKRLDIPAPGSEIPAGRKRYFFGKEHDNRVHMDRHYQIEKNAIRFAWQPAEHYGDIHIDSLRCSISASAMKELLFAGFSGANINSAVNSYFKAYHRILERILNTADPDEILLDEQYLADFTAVSAVKPEILEEDLSPLYRFFPENLIRFFTGDDSMPSDNVLRTALITELKNRWDHAADFITRLHTFNQWKHQLGELREKDSEAQLPLPVCSKDDVLNPPRTCRISDSTLIAWVFRYFNLFLDNDKKFRQLPPGEQHRGMIDHEYQLVHALIGKYSLDPKGLEIYIQKKKPELLPALEKLNPVISRLRKEDSKNRPPKLSKWGKPVPSRPSLSMLAEAAAECYIEFCSAKVDFWENNPDCSSDKLRKACRKFGIRTGMPLDRNSLLKTLLHVDLASWMKAYDREHRANFENRSLNQDGHVISQIPFPNDFAHRIMLKSAKDGLAEFIRRPDGKEPFFDFNAAFRAMSTEIAPRDFYDVSPLVSASCLLKKQEDISAVPGLNPAASPDQAPIDFSRNALAKAICSIKECRSQDKLLLKIAYAYWQRFQSAGAFICGRKKNPPKTELEQVPSIYDYFDASVLLKFRDSGDDRTIRIMPNDINRPILSQIRFHAPAIAAFMDPEGKADSFDFYEMLKAYRIIQMRDRAKRLDVIPLVNAFASSAVIPPENYKKGDSDYNRNMEFSFYSKKFPALTMDDYNQIADMRNAVFHRGLDLKFEDGIRTLKKYVSVPVRKPAYAGKKPFRRF